MSGSASPRLTVSGLTVAFGGLTALKDVSFTVEADETVALIGPNGAGKTTVFNAVCSLTRPKSGTISINGRPGPDSPSALLERGVSRTLQGLGLFSGLTALENVLVPLTSLPQRSEAARTAAAVLERLGLSAYADTPVDSLPYPVRKRVALARALATSPSLLLLDEPAGGLSREDIRDLADVVRSLKAEGSAVLLVEHHVEFVMEVADRVVVLDFGQVVAFGTPDEVRSDPAVEAAYLGLEAA